MFMIAPLEVVAQGILRRTTIGNTHFSYTYLRQGLLPTLAGVIPNRAADLLTGIQIRCISGRNPGLPLPLGRYIRRIFEALKSS